MFYWLFTDGRELLGGCLAPLLCLGALVPLVVAWLLGAGIQRNDDISQSKGRYWLLLAVAYGTVCVTVTALYVALLGDFAVRRGAGRTPASELVRFLSGAPPGVDQNRLFLGGVLLICTLLTAAVMLHQARRRGGWLRVWVDWLRRPAVRRRAMGSSHFCTSREFRRYRRADADGIILLGAF